MNRNDMGGFLRRVLPRRGWLCAARPIRRTQYSYWRNTPHADVDALAANLAAIDAAGGDAYMALAGFRDAERAHENPAKAARGVKRFYRTQDNVDTVRSLWLDIDVKPERDDAYATADEATRAITRFIHDANLPWPLVVASGHGYHLYWPFSEDLRVSTWRSVATLLKVITQGLGLKADHACTTDAARILRPVGTLNRKDPLRPRPVELVRVNDAYTSVELVERLVAAAKPFRTQLMSLVQARTSDLTPASGRINGNAAHTEGLLAALDASLPKSAEPVILGCRQVREAAFAREDVWRGMLSVVRLCVQGERWCHALSARDTTRYRREDTDAKLATLAHQQGAGGMPMTCATFNDRRPGVCDTCPHHGLIRSPIVLGLDRLLPADCGERPEHLVRGDGQLHAGLVMPHTVVPAMAPVMTLRDPRFELVLPDEMDERRPMGVWFLERVKDGNGNEQTQRVRMMHQPVHVTEAVQGHDDEGRETFRYWVRAWDSPRHFWYAFDLSGSLLSRPVDLVGELYTRGVTLAPGQEHHTVEYMRAYVRQIRRRNHPVPQYAHEGWVSADTFTTGTNMYTAVTPAGDTPARVEITPVRLTRTAAGVARWLTTAGLLENWKRAANLYAKPGQEAMAFALFTAFGAPLLHFTDCAGLLVHLCGESGTGKTSVMCIAAAIWGQPGALVAHAPLTPYGNTRNALMATLGVLRNIPLMFDEVAMTKPEEVFPLLLALASGKERDRMTSALDLSQGRFWQSVYLSAGNRSLRDMLTGTNDAEHAAVLNRLLEIHLPPINPADQSWIAEQPVVSLAADNYGHAGQVYVQWMVANASKLAGLIRERLQVLMRHAQANRDERMWFTALAAILTGAELARAAGLHDIDVARVERWVIDMLLPAQRQEVKESRSGRGAWLAEFLNENIGSTVIVMQSHEPRDPALAADYVVRDIAPGGTLKVRFEQKSRRAYISRKAFRNWCQRRHIDYQDTLADMRRNGQLLKARCRSALGRGLAKYGSAELRTDCLCVQITDDMLGAGDDDDSSTE
ncbi:DUF927 domain-containing protein [Paraburkholderia dinghuensis]|uniref:DUF927 domain-containing protein n=1 Tax=Paraburkholderia dinghuensis TaxID=2305225 RepID=A0A3N6NCC7_9BURK|nr:DUF927 domain-containing protein [Paraburkholderia dinghuensis]RQH06612.1 DUF927 domain-containing protein [Paraburkholderia dinghuensis]